jgi:hypothetical protein
MSLAHILNLPPFLDYFNYDEIIDLKYLCKDYVSILTSKILKRKYEEKKQVIKKLLDHNYINSSQDLAINCYTIAIKHNVDVKTVEIPPSDIGYHEMKPLDIIMVNISIHHKLKILKELRYKSVIYVLNNFNRHTMEHVKEKYYSIYCSDAFLRHNYDKPFFIQNVLQFKHNANYVLFRKYEKYLKKKYDIDIWEKDPNKNIKQNTRALTSYFRRVCTYILVASQIYKQIVKIQSIFRGKKFRKSLT